MFRPLLLSTLLTLLGFSTHSCSLLRDTSRFDESGSQQVDDYDYERGQPEYHASPQFLDDETAKLAALRVKAEAGDAKAMYDLGRMLHYAADELRDEEAAIHWLVKAADNGVVAAEFELGCTLGLSLGAELGYKPEDGFAWTMKAAQHDYPSAYVVLASSYAYGTKLKEDPEKAIFWYRKALAAGWLRCGFDLSRLFAKGGIAGYQPVEQLKWSLVPIYVFSSRNRDYLASNPHLTQMIEEMRAEMTPHQIEEAELGARRWISDHPFGPDDILQ